MSSFGLQRTGRVVLGLACGVGLTLGLGLWVVSDASGFPWVDLDHDRPREQGGFYSLALPEPNNCNPYTASGAVARRVVLRFTHDTLAEYDPVNGAMRDSLANNWDASADGRTLRFTLREGARFSDGTPVTMDDVLFAYHLHEAKVPLGAVGSALEDVESMRAVDGESSLGSLEVKLKTVTFTSLSSFATGYIVGKRDFFLAKVAELARTEGAPPPEIGDPAFAKLFAEIDLPGPGSGPYTLHRWDRGVRLYLTQSPVSWRRSARPFDWNLGGIHIQFEQDPTQCFVLARQGKLDLYPDPDAQKTLQAHPELAETHRAITYAHTGNGHYLVVWNHRRGALGKPAVRRALTMLFDRDDIIKTAFSGTAKRSKTWFRPGSPNDISTATAIPFDPAAAREALRVAGHPDLELEILFAASQRVHKRIMDIATPAFVQAGVQLKATPMEWAAMSDRLDAGDFDAMILVVNPGVVVDPYTYFHASQIEGGYNWMGYSNPKVNDLLHKARTELNDARRAGYFREFNDIFVQDQPVTLLVHPLSSVLFSTRFMGVEIGAHGLSPEKWWVPVFTR